MQPASEQEFQTALATGRKIDAIRLYRELHPGTGLAEAKQAVEELMRQGVPHPNPGVNDEAILAAIFSANKIKAIKLYRDTHPGTGLAEAKEFIEQLTDELYKISPEKFSSKPLKGAGCSTVVLTFVVLVFTVLSAWVALR